MLEEHGWLLFKEFKGRAGSCDIPKGFTNMHKSEFMVIIQINKKDFE
jgi:hypothetical protein